MGNGEHTSHSKGWVHVQKGLRAPTFSRLAGLQALCGQEVKAKAELQPALLRVKAVPQHRANMGEVSFLFFLQGNCQNTS